MKRLLGMELATDVIFLILSSVNNDLFIYIFVASVGCEIRYVGAAELKNIPYISASVSLRLTLASKKPGCLN